MSTSIFYWFCLKTLLKFCYFWDKNYEKSSSNIEVDRFNVEVDRFSIKLKGQIDPRRCQEAPRRRPLGAPSTPRGKRNKKTGSSGHRHTSIFKGNAAGVQAPRPNRDFAKTGVHTQWLKSLKIDHDLDHDWSTVVGIGGKNTPGPLARRIIIIIYY